MLAGPQEAFGTSRDPSESFWWLSGSPTEESSDASCHRFFRVSRMIPARFKALWNMIPEEVLGALSLLTQAPGSFQRSLWFLENSLQVFSKFKWFFWNIRRFLNVQGFLGKFGGVTGSSCNDR